MGHVLCPTQGPPVIGGHVFADATKVLSVIPPSSDGPCPERLLIVTRADNAASEEWGEYYRQARRVPRANWCRVPCSANETLANYATFQAEVETPIINWLAANPLVARNITTILIGYGVPGKYNQPAPPPFPAGTQGLSTTSRLARIGQPPGQCAYGGDSGVAVLNPLHTYDPRPGYGVWDPSGESVRRITRSVLDSVGVSYLVGRIDAPSLALAKVVVDRAVALDSITLGGTGFLDPYGFQGGVYELYEDVLENWGNSPQAQRLNQTIARTAASDPGSNVQFSSISGDDWYFGWYALTVEAAWFGAQGAGSRVFCWDADSYGAQTLRSTSSKRWCPQAITAGYALTAGATSEPYLDAMLSPFPFFEALRRGLTFIEAFYQANPFLEWMVTPVGDPLARVNFPGQG